MPMTDPRQIAASAIEVGLAFLTGDTNVTQADGLRLLEALQGDLEAVLAEVTKTIDGKPRPAGDFLVVEDPEKTTTWHLPVKVNGKPDHNLMGAAKAALGPGYRGNKYEGPDKEKAIKKLKALYKSEDMEWSEAAMNEMYDEPVAIMPFQALTFADLAAADAANEQAENVRQLTRQFQMLFENVMYSDEVDDKLGAVRGLVDELAALMGEGPPMDDVEAQAEDGESDLAESAGGFLALAEGDATPADGNRAPLRVEFALIKPGFGNKRDNNYYPADVLKRDCGVFEGVKMYTTDHRAGEKSERTEVAVVEQMPVRFLDDGTPVGMAAIFDPAFAEKTRNRAAMGQLHTLENSILGRGKSKKGEVAGKKANIVEALTEGISVDWVTTAGAGGRALNLAEAESEIEEVNDMKIEDERIEDEQQPEPEPEPEPEPVTEGAEEQQPVWLSEDAVTTILADAKLPDTAKERLRVIQYPDQDALKEAVQAEADYIKELTKAGQPVVTQGKPTQAPSRTAAERQETMSAVNSKWFGNRARIKVQEVKK